VTARATGGVEQVIIEGAIRESQGLNIRQHLAFPFATHRTVEDIATSRRETMGSLPSRRNGPSWRLAVLLF